MTEQTKSVGDLLAEIGRDHVARDALVAALVAWEDRHQKQNEGNELRETVTGPIVDALFRADGAVTRRLTSGLVFTLPYLSKIAREFAMAAEPLAHVWEPQTSRLLVALAARAKTVVVGGAYAGDQAVLIAQALASRGGKVHCFELNPPQLAALEANARQNKLTNVVVNAKGLWDRSGHIELVGHDSHAFPRFVAERTEDSFPVTTIEAYAESADASRIDLIMLDIEGGEENALRGAQRFLEQLAGEAPDIVFEIHRSYVDWSNGLAKTSIVRLLTERGYSIYAIRDYQANVNMANAPLEMVTLETTVLDGPPHGFNMFATKRPNALNELGVQLRKNVSPKLLRHRLSPVHQPGQ
jgi:FkbM family methyltransferase